MSIRSYYYFKEKEGKIIYDYFDKNNLTLKDNTFLQNWNNKYLFTSEKNNYFYKDINYTGSFTLILKLKLLNLNLQENIKYLIFDSSNNINNYSFGIFLIKSNNKYSYNLKLDNLNGDYEFYEIYNLEDLNNLHHNIVIKWNEDVMDINTYFFQNLDSLNKINESRKCYSYDPYHLYYQGNLPNNDGLEIYSINLKRLSLGGGILKNNNFNNFLGNINLFLIDNNLYTDNEIFNVINYDKTTIIDEFFIGSNYFENTNGYLLKDYTNFNNIIFEYMKQNKPSFLENDFYDILNSNNNLNGWLKYDYTKTNQFNSYLFSNNLEDYFQYTFKNDNYFPYSFTIWTKGKNLINESSIFSITIPSSNIEYKYITLDLIIKPSNNNYSYYLDISGRDEYFNKIPNYNQTSLIGIVNENFKWDHLCICYNNVNNFQNNYGIIKTYLNKEIITEINSNLRLDLKKNSKIYLGLNSSKNKKFTGFISGIQLFNEYIDQVVVDRTFDDLENCYHPDTKILTKNGYVKIKNLNRGDQIYTLNNDYQKLARLIVTPTKKKYDEYILFKKGCFGPNIPNEDLIITKGHPVYYKNNFYNPEDFVNSYYYDVEFIKLNIQKVYHLQFEEHYIINSNNIHTTSLPSNTNYLNLYLPKKLYFNKEKFNKENIGKHYPPYFLHNDPIPLGRLE